MFQTLTSG